MFCSNCGKENEDSHQFCFSCGAPLVKPQKKVKPAAPEKAQKEAKPAAPEIAQRQSKPDLRIFYVIGIALVIIIIVLSIGGGSGGGNSRPNDNDQFTSELPSEDEDFVGAQDGAGPDTNEQSEGEDFVGALNAAGPDTNDEVELNIGGIQLFYDPNLISDIQGEWQEASGSNMIDPYPAYMHYDLIQDAGTISLIEVFSLEYYSYSLELALDELEGLLQGQQTTGLECIPEVSKDSSIQNCWKQQILSNIKYLDFKNGSGVRWVTVYAHQDAVAISNEFLDYRFQGLSHDGECYLKASFRITHDDLQDSAMIPNDVYSDASGDLLQKYFNDYQTLLDSNPSGYQPFLEHFDAIIESLAVGKCGAG